MPLKNGTFFKPANGRYIVDFLGTEDGPRFDRKKDNGTVKNEGTIIWNFSLYNQDGSPVVDPGTGQSPAQAQGMTSETVGVGRGVEAKARRWLRALLAARGQAFDDAIDPNMLVQRAIGARAIGNFGRSAGGKDGTLLDIEPFSPGAGAVVDSGLVNIAVMPGTQVNHGNISVSGAPGASATIPAVEPAAAYAAASGEPDDLPF